MIKVLPRTSPSTGLAALERVEERPETRDALRAGEISIAQATAIAAAPAQHEAELLGLARTLPNTSCGEDRTRPQARLLGIATNAHREGNRS
jgi:hypothetical protein